MEMDNYGWRRCSDCGIRIFPDEVENVDIKMIDDKLYCKTCAHIIETGDIYYEGED